jgi:hypothetical protein
MESPTSSKRGLAYYWLPLSIAFGVSYVAARLLLELDLPRPWPVVAALLPVLPFCLWLLAAIQGIRQSDELEQRIHLEALVVAFPLTLILLMTLGLLEMAVELSPDDWSYRHVWAMLPILYLLGLTLARRRYS